jgi:hypothetical protein
LLFVKYIDFHYQFKEFTQFLITLNNVKKSLLNMKIAVFLLMIILSYISFSCDNGLKPPEESKPKTGLSGTIYYSNWPPADSIKLLKVVFFKTFPPNDIFNEVINGNARTYPEALPEGLPLDVTSTDYEIELTAETYEYITVAQQYGPDVLSQWRAVGQYNTHPGDSLPTAVTVIKDSLLQGIDIYVDFNDLPVQHFKRP